MRHQLILLVLGAGMAVPAWGDSIQLKDGTKLEGDLKKGSGGYVLTDSAGKSKFIANDRVKSIELGLGASAAASPDRAQANLDSHRRSVGYLGDIDEIIKRYERFIEQSAGTSVEETARQDLAEWRERREQGLVKYGTRWVTPQDKAALQEQALRQANEARRALRDGKLEEADSLLSQALSEDPNNVTALYLRGLLQAKQDQLVPARKSFEAVNEQAPNHAPTLNNIAVILGRQNQFPASLNMYDQAMQASPRNRSVLDNVAQAIWNLPDAQRDSAITQRVMRRFNEQDVALANELGPQGLHRWGGTWVTTAQLEELKEAEREAKDKLDRLSAEFDGVKVGIDNIDKEIEENERSMRRLETTAYVRDINGQIWQSALPPIYDELREDNRKLQRERAEQFARLDRLREQAKAVNRDLPVPKFTGIQQLMDDEHAPIVPPSPAPPATMPNITTQPT